MAKPSRQSIEKIERYRTRLLVDSRKENFSEIGWIQGAWRFLWQFLTQNLTIRVSHLLLSLSHEREVLGDRIGQIFKPSQLNLQRLQLFCLCNIIVVLCLDSVLQNQWNFAFLSWMAGWRVILDANLENVVLVGGEREFPLQIGEIFAFVQSVAASVCYLKIINSFSTFPNF